MIGLRSFDITLTGKTPLLMHYDNIAWADTMDTWKNQQTARDGKSKAGDDRSPAWRWLGALYHDNDVIALPSDNIMRMLMEGGSMVLVPGGKSGKTFKAQTQSGLLSGEAYWPLKVKGKTIRVAPFLALQDESDFSTHQTLAKKSGFDLFVKRAKVGQSKHVRVRPMFEAWSVSGTITVLDDQITGEALHEFLLKAGQFKGLGDWRPSGPTPGPYGTFGVEIAESV